MNSATIAVHWHDENQPVYSVDFQPTKSYAKSKRLATAGGDNNVRIWKLSQSKQGVPEDTSVEYLSTLRKHTQAVNVVRFDPKGETLATAGDDGSLILWSLADSVVVEFGHQDDDVQESWVVKHMHSSNSEIYDLCWSEDSKFIATGSMDNALKIFSAETGKKLIEISDHSHYVQGVAWDPLNEYVATQSADRSVNIYKLSSGDKIDDALKLSQYSKISRTDLIPSRASTLANKGRSAGQEGEKSEASGVASNTTSSPRKSGSSSIKRSTNLYQSETLQSFFRRLSFSPDGSLLLTPSGIFKHEDPSGDAAGTDTAESTSLNTVYIYTRSGLNRAPICHLPGLNKASVAVSFSPIKYQLSESAKPPVFSLPYKMVFAVATHDSVIIYDTQHLQPLGISSNLHYLTITDLCWDRDGQSIIVSSAEGFCSVIVFDAGVFGQIHGTEEPEVASKMSDTSMNPTPEVKREKTIPEESTSLFETDVEMIDDASIQPKIEPDTKPNADPRTISKKKSPTAPRRLQPENVSAPATASVTNNLLSQFIANPISFAPIEKVETKADDANTIEISDDDMTDASRKQQEPRPDINDRPKKKRITPTLIQK